MALQSCWFSDLHPIWNSNPLHSRIDDYIDSCYSFGQYNTIPPTSHKMVEKEHSLFTRPSPSSSWSSIGGAWKATNSNNWLIPDHISPPTELQYGLGIRNFRNEKPIAAIIISRLHGRRHSRLGSYRELQHFHWRTMSHSLSSHHVQQQARLMSFCMMVVVVIPSMEIRCLLIAIGG